MPNGVVEHEICPVVVAETAADPVLNRAEVAEASWVGWDALCERARDRPATLSPWAVGQITDLAGLMPSPRAWLRNRGRHGLDVPIVCPSVAPVAGPSPAIDPLAPIRVDVERILRRFVTARAADLAAIDPSLAAVAREISQLVGAGGKRLRPAFVYWGHRASGAEHDSAVAHIAAAVEMLHTFALLHDDVMDKATTRRGRLAAGRSFTLAHAAERLSGDGSWFGTSAAILAGDLAFVWADQLLDSAPLGSAAVAQARKVFTTLRVEVMAGQYLDLRLDQAAAARPEAARRVALLKSGRYTVTRPLELGLAVSGDGVAASRPLAAYGDAIGLAFQLRDDVLGLFGDPGTTGKSAVDDQRAGKRTLLMLRAASLATGAQRAYLERCLGDQDLEEDAADRCRRIVERTGALASVETLIRHEHDVAVAAVADLPEPARQALVALASIAVERDR
jgi:geranylgeranyl diphosphate synthase type I